MRGRSNSASLVVCIFPRNFVQIRLEFLGHLLASRWSVALGRRWTTHAWVLGLSRAFSTKVSLLFLLIDVDSRRLRGLWVKRLFLRMWTFLRESTPEIRDGTLSLPVYLFKRSAHSAGPGQLGSRGRGVKGSRVEARAGGVDF